MANRKFEEDVTAGLGYYLTKTQVTALMGLGITSLIALIGIIVTLRVQK